MFKKLVASEGTKKGLFTPGAGLASLLIHAGLIALFLAVGVGAEAASKRSEELVDYMEVEEEKAKEPEPPKPEEPPPPPPEEKPAEAPPVIKGTQELVPPEEPPARIPDVDPTQQAANAEDFSGQGKLGGVANGVETGVAQDVTNRTQPVDEGTYDLESVQEKPELQNRNDLVRNLSRNYPPLLRDAGVNGEVQVKFRVNEEGRVDAESIEILSTSHEAFGDATRRVVERMRFRPAKVDGRSVKVWVILPITWQVPR